VAGEASGEALLCDGFGCSIEGPKKSVAALSRRCIGARGFGGSWPGIFSNAGLGIWVGPVVIRRRRMGDPASDEDEEECVRVRARRRVTDGNVMESGLSNDRSCC
jgi:hypothetical protein